MDNLTEKQRQLCMRRIQSRDTKPEQVVRKILTGLGLRYRLHVKKLPGKPDIVMKGRNTVIFVNGCFWHQHDGCSRKSMPKSNRDYWKPKLKRNIERQDEIISELAKDGWKIIKVWECQTKNKTAKENLISELAKKLL